MPVRCRVAVVSWLSLSSVGTVSSCLRVSLNIFTRTLNIFSLLAPSVMWTLFFSVHFNWQSSVLRSVWTHTEQSSTMPMCMLHIFGVADITNTNDPYSHISAHLSPGLVWTRAQGSMETLISRDNEQQSHLCGRLALMWHTAQWRGRVWEWLVIGSPAGSVCLDCIPTTTLGNKDFPLPQNNDE